MKKISALLLLAICTFTYSYGQHNVVGGDFEHWKLNTTWNYYEPDSSIFRTLNALDSVGAGVTTFRCDTAHSGTYSVGLKTSEISALFITIPGVAGTSKIDWLHQRAILGMPYPYGSKLPLRFTGYYQSYPVANDSTAAVLLLSKWNTGTHHRDTLAYNRLAFHGTVNSWTLFDTLVTYRDQSRLPDTMTMLLLSCAGFNASNMFGSVGTVGTRAFFDDVDLLDLSGVPMQVMPSMKVRLSPNPVSQILTVDLENNIENGFFEILDVQGKLIRKISINGVSGKISVSDLSSGSYFYKLSEESKLLNTGKFIVVK